MASRIACLVLRTSYKSNSIQRPYCTFNVNIAGSGTAWAEGSADDST